MGKRKSRQVQSKGPSLKVATVFDCPFCSRRDTIEIKLHKRENVGKLFCRVCTVKYETKLGPLTKPVDIYCEWIDEAEKVNQKPKGLGLHESHAKHEDQSEEAAAEEDSDDEENV